MKSQRWIIVTQGDRTVDAMPISTFADLAAERDELQLRYPLPKYGLSYYRCSEPVTAQEITAGWETDGFRDHEETGHRSRTL